jgi:hypothetical protein
MATSKTKKTSGAASSKKRAAAPTSGSMIPYGDPIRDAIARGEVQEMRKLAASTRKWIDDVQKGLDRLDKAVKKGGK